MASQNSSEIAKRTVKRPRRRRGHERVAALIEAGAGVLAEKGFDAATMTEIAERAGASIGSLYQFFPTKEQLAAEIHARQLEALAAMLDELVGEAKGVAVEQAADRFFSRLVAFLEANPVFTVVTERRGINPAVKKKARARLRGCVAALLAAVAPPVAPERRAALAAVILHLIRVAAMLKADDDVAIRDSAIAEIKAMLRGALLTAGD
jgi:AcrR family transcriptional regulator